MLDTVRFDVDATTYVLLAVAGGLYALRWALFWKPDPLVHPLILGRQAEPSPVRHSGESPVWMNGLSIGRGVVSRPDATTRTVGDLIGKADAALRGRAEALAQGLGRLLPKGGPSEPRTIAVVLPHAEGSSSIRSNEADARAETLHILAAIALLSPACTVLLAPPEAPREASAAIAKAQSSLAAVITTPQLLGSLMTALSGPGGELLLVVVGESEKGIERPGYRVFSLEQVLEPAAGSVVVSTDAQAKPEDVFIRLVASSPDAQFNTIPLTHVNFTAAVHALHHVTPSQRRLTAADTILSFISPRRPVGLSIALTAAHVGAALTVADHGHEDGVGVLAACKPLRPTVLYLTPRQAHSLSVVLKDLGTQAFVANDGLYQRALYAKSHHLRAGYVGPHWIWDRVLFAGIRTETSLDRMRLVVVVSEGADQPGRSTLDVLRIHLGCPVVSTLAHPRLPTLIAAAHPFDLQYNDERVRGPMDTPNVHVGAGVVNLEVKLVPDGGEAAFSEHDQRGRVRRPFPD